MNTLNMPGFTAEDSLYQTNGHYRAMGSTFNAVVVGQGVVPQAIDLLKCLGGCHFFDSSDFCQLLCFWEEAIRGGGSGGGGGGGSQTCSLGCGPCHPDPDSPTGGYKFCVRHDCSIHNIACETRPVGGRPPYDGLMVGPILTVL